MLTRSSVKFYLDARYGPDPIVGGAATHIRDGAGYARDFDRVMRSKRRNQYRTEWETIGGEHRSIILLEPARTNRCANSRDFSTWTNSNTTLTTGQEDPERTKNATLITSTSAAGYRKKACTFTATGTKCVSVELRPGSAAVTRVSVIDTTGPTTRREIDITWSTLVASNVTGSGAIYPVEVLADGWYSIKFEVPSVDHTHTNELYIYPHATSTGSVYAFDAQIEDGAYPTRKIPTAGAATARPADSLYYATPPLPGAMAVYMAYVHTGDKTDSPYRNLIYPISGSGTKYWGVRHDNNNNFIHVFNAGGGATEFSLADSTPVAGDIIELVTIVQGTDAHLIMRKNLKTVTGANGTVGTPPTSWDATSVLWINGYQGINVGALKLERLMWVNADDMVFQQSTDTVHQIVSELANFHLGSNGEVLRA